MFCSCWIDSLGVGDLNDLLSGKRKKKGSKWENGFGQGSEGAINKLPSSELLWGGGV